ENAYALVIGIANYQHISSLPELVLRDAQGIYDLLIDPQYCGYSPHNVQLLLDDQATRDHLRQALAHLAQCSNQDSTVFLYISSHGGRIEAGSHSGEYLLPVDVVADSYRSIAKTA